MSALTTLINELRKAHNNGANESVGALANTLQHAADVNADAKDRSDEDNKDAS